MKHVAPKELPIGNPLSASIFQALRFLGNGSIDEEVISRLRRRRAGRQRELPRKAALHYGLDWRCCQTDCR